MRTDPSSISSRRTSHAAKPRFRDHRRRLAVAALACATLHGAPVVAAPDDVQIGPRPAWLVDTLADGELKSALEACDASAVEPRPFSIGHRGAPLQFPEHTREGYVAAARMGAGIVECDVTFTKDRELVCRHSQCDLATTTNILETDLADACRVPPDPSSDTPFAAVECCTSDITLAEFGTLEGRMDAGNPEARTVEAFLDATAAWRTDLYAGSATLMTHAESIALFDELGVGMTPELKEPLVDMPFESGGDAPYTQADYASQLIEEYREAGIDPSRVWPQSFDQGDVEHWIETAPEFGRQAVMLDDRYADEGFDPMDETTWSPTMTEFATLGVTHLAPPTWMLVTTDEGGTIVPSPYARAAADAGLKLIAWTLERSGPAPDAEEWYFQSLGGAPSIGTPGVALELLDVLARDVGVVGVFSDWPATTTFYAHCMADELASTD